MRVYRQDITPDPGWLVSVGQLLGAGGVGILLRELVKLAFQRAKDKDDLGVGLRSALIERLEKVEKQLTAVEERERVMYRRSVALEAENQTLRRRWHALMNWMQSEPSLPQPPAWLYERVEGPTADPPAPKPKPKPKPEGDRT